MSVVMHGWQSESTDGPKVVVVVGVVAMVTAPRSVRCGKVVLVV